MSTFTPNFDQFAIDQLRFKLLKKNGWSVSNKPDCSMLADLILQSGFGPISESTLYRLFFQFEKHKPYKNTLDILSRFLGFKDCLEFMQSIDQQREELHHSGIFTQKERHKSLMFYCIEHTTKSPLMDFFDSLSDYSYQFKIDLSVAIFDSLLISTKQNWFFKNFTHQTYVRKYFFEKSHDIKFRIKNYDLAYVSYLEGVNPDRDYINLQDFIFGNCVLFRHYFISNNKNEAIKISKKIYKQIKPLDSLKSKIYIFPYIRYMAYKLWYLETINKSAHELELYANYLIEFAAQLNTELSFVEKKFLLHTLSETFIHSSIPDQYHWELKRVFLNLYKTIHPGIYQKHLKYSLPYFCENGLLHFRP